MTTRFSATALSDPELLEATQRLAGYERKATANLIVALTEVEQRRLYLRLGCSSLFAYCMQVLHLSEHAAYARIEAARAAQRYPVILDLLQDGSLTLTAVRLLAGVLTQENHAEVLASARHKSKREVEEIVAMMRPLPDAIPRRPVVVQLAPDCYFVQLTISSATHGKLRRAQDLLRHTIPNGDAALIFDRALTVLVDHVERVRFAAAARPRQARFVSAHSRHIPAAVRREVWKRDEGRCAFVGSEGRCAERGFLEFHHVVPYAVGGVAETGNIELRCRAHNAYEAELFFSSDVVREQRPAWG